MYCTVTYTAQCLKGTLEYGTIVLNTSNILLCFGRTDTSEHIYVRKVKYIQYGTTETYFTKK